MKDYKTVQENTFQKNRTSRVSGRRPFLERVLIGFLFFVIAGPAGWSSLAGEGTMLREDVTVSGPGSVRIGVLVPKKGIHAAEGASILNAARLAVREANRRGGYRNRPFEIVTRSDEGLWSTGAREIMRLAYEDSVWAILGSVDGQGAHMVQQVITKGKMPFVTSWASDYSLSRGNIIWFFHCFPDDRSQAGVLLNEVFGRKKFTRVAVVRQAKYDGQRAMEAFKHVATERRLTLTGEYATDEKGLLPAGAIQAMKKGRLQAIILLGHPGVIGGLPGQLARNGISAPLYGTMALGAASFTGQVRAARLELTVVTPGSGGRKAFETFEDGYRAVYKKVPDAAAAYAYDAANAIIAAIRQGGLDRYKIRDSLAGLQMPGGVTGTIHFDKTRNLMTEPGLQTVR